MSDTTKESRYKAIDAARLNDAQFDALSDSLRSQGRTGSTSWQSAATIEDSKEWQAHTKSVQAEDLSAAIEKYKIESAEKQARIAALEADIASRVALEARIARLEK